MKKIMIVFVLSIPAFGDELILSDGNKIEWKVLEDKGDSYVVTPLRGPKVTLKKSEIREVKVGRTGILLTGATFTTEDGKMTVEKAQGKPVDLLSLIDPKKSLVPGNNGKSTAEFKDGKSLQIESTPDRYARLEMPAVESGILGYDLSITLERMAGNTPIFMGLQNAGARWTMATGGWNGGNGLYLVDKKPLDLSAERSRESVLNEGQVTLAYYVRPQGFVVTGNGKEIFSWEGDWKRLSIPQEWTPKKQGCIFIGLSESKVIVHSMTLTPVVKK